MADRRRPAVPSATRCGICSATSQGEAFDNPGRRRWSVRARDPVRYQRRRVRAVDSPLHRAGQTQLVHPVRGDVDEGARRHHSSTFTRTDRSPICRSSAPSPIDAFNNAAFGALPARTRRSRCRLISRRQGVLHRHVLLQRNAAAVTRLAAARAADPAARCFIVYVVLRVGAMNAAGRRRPRTDRHRQERARAGAGRALRRRDHQLRFDGGVSRVRHRHRQGAVGRSARHPPSPHRHRRPDRRYTAAQYARDAAAVDSRYSRARRGCRSWSAAPGFTFAR